ncbi:hypothetical protein DEI99_014655 [Curtobacterium sp. MCLR17_036]|uniref:hypothetical protein n=1 Tax=Curtobacterium sp. MCLR17_036 TaxID=2175620 RepID=UPI0024E00C51|nr:hypothetical protein [Curtobacterium sp. MCLR17_036]WIE64454.1 hypothetical protein DEI99_014655 [Curtobacterium sp. MCLR17_036]
MFDDDGHAPPDGGRSSGPWIAGSIVALLTGWFLAFVTVLSTAMPYDQWPDDGRLVLLVIAFVIGAGVPFVGILVLRRDRPGEPEDGSPGLVACVLAFGLGALTLGPLLLVQGAAIAGAAVERAQPPTDVESSRTVSQAQDELRVLGDRVVASMGRDSTAPPAEVETDSCGLDNHSPGTMVRYWWRLSDAGTPVPSASSTPAIDDAGEPALRLLRAEGYHLEQRFSTGGGRLYDEDSWVGAATIDGGGTSVLLESQCLVDPDASSAD